MKTLHTILKRYLLLYLTVALGACGTIKLKEDKNYSKKGLTVSFQRIIGIEDDIEDYQIDHPIKISTKLVQNQLLFLWYRMGGKGKNIIPVFTSEEAIKLSPLFKSALNKMEIGEYLKFEYNSEKGMIEGEVFASTGKIHWRFGRIHDLYFSKELFGDSGPSWGLVRRLRGQEIHSSKTTFGKIKSENWIINDFQLPTPRPRSNLVEKPAAPKAVSKSAKPSVRLTSETKQKLRMLKELLDEGLIDQEEYQLKKKEILDRDFR